MAQRDFEDSAFGSRSSFDFDEDVANMGHGMAEFQGYHGQDLDFHLMNGM